MAKTIIPESQYQSLSSILVEHKHNVLLVKEDGSEYTVASYAYKKDLNKVIYIQAYNQERTGRLLNNIAVSNTDKFYINAAL